MTIPPDYQITSEMMALLVKIDSQRLLFQTLTIPTMIKEKIQRVGYLKSSLFSARIEGNPLSMEELEISADQLKKKEVTNLLTAASWIEKNIKIQQLLDRSLLIKIHELVMKDLSVSGFRREMGAIFNQAGVAVYLSPPPEKIVPLLDQLLYYLNATSEKFPLIKGLIGHLVFEKIHPFIDGNGRSGRLLINLVLKTTGYIFPFPVPFEEYLDDHKSEYYRFLDLGFKQTEDYLIFMLEGYLGQLTKIKEQIESEMNKKPSLLLPPRQEEIYYLIREHRLVSVDFIKRRFLKVPVRTLRYDLKKLADRGLINKIGRTKSSYYTNKI